jgi:hypothetical protein
MQPHTRAGFKHRPPDDKDAIMTKIVRCCTRGSMFATVLLSGCDPLDPPDGDHVTVSGVVGATNGPVFMVFHVSWCRSSFEATRLK